MQPEFAGRGISHPFGLGVAGLRESAGPAKIEESIRIILGTGYGERVMRPDFGCNLRSLVFAPNNTSTANLARYYVEEALTRAEPRIELVEVAVENDHRHGRLTIRITYRLRATREVHQLVQPFHLEPTP